MQEVVSQAALFKANRKEANVELQKPFNSWMDITTVKSYTHVWKQLLCYVFRAEDEDIDKRPAYRLQGQQQIAIQEVQAVIQEFQAWKQDQPILNPMVKSGLILGYGPIETPVKKVTRG